MDCSTFFPIFLLLALAAAHSDSPTDWSTPSPTASPKTPKPRGLPIAAAAIVCTASAIIILAAIGTGIWWYRRRPWVVKGDKAFAGDTPLVERMEREKKIVYVYPTLGKLGERMRGRQG
jgi:hypothetical protein